MKFIVKLLPVLFLWSSLSAQVQDTMYLRYQSDIVEKLLVDEVDSFKINASEDSLLIYQRDIVFGQKVQFVNKKALAVIDSIYFYHSFSNIQEKGFFQSYTLNGHDEVVAFDPGAGMDSVLNLTITGADVTTADLHSVAYKIDKVKGVFTLDGTDVKGWPITFFADVSLDSSIVIINSVPSFNNINAFEFAVVGVVNGDLILENNPGLDFVWGDELPEGERTTGFMGVTGVKGDLIIRNCPKLGSNFSGMESVEFVDGDLIIDNGADGMTSIRTLYNFSKMSVKTIGGNLTITNCGALSSLSGLENLISIGGDVTITNNGTLGEGIPMSANVLGEPGFCWVKDAKDAGTIQADAIITLSDKDDISIDYNSLFNCDYTPPAYPSYVITDNQEALDFVAMDTVMNLTIEGAVWITGFNAIKDKALSLTNGKMVVLGELTLQNLSLADDINGFVNSLQLDSSLIIRNWTNDGTGLNVNNFKALTEIKGDLIIEDCKVNGFTWPAGNGFTNITTVAGDLILRNENTFIGTGFSGIVSVGGDFIIDNCDGAFWDLSAMASFISVGGNIVFTNNGTVNSLGGLQNLTSIGGDVTVTGNNAIPLGMAGAYPGFCLIKDARTSGIIKAGATVTLADKDGVEILESALSSCL